MGTISTRMDVWNLLTIEHINAQSLLSQIDEIELLIKNRNIDILCISETWLDEGIKDSFVQISDFNVYRCDYGRRGGGVCIYVRNDLKVNRIEVNIDRIVGVEDVWITIQRKKLPSFIVGCVYRHPKALASSFQYLKAVFKELCLRKKPVFILGDVNDNLFESNSKLGKILHQLNLSQTIDKPTRITNTSSTLLDVIITNKLQMVCHSDVIPSPIADHELITLKIDISKPKRQPQMKKFRCLRNYSQDRFCHSLVDRTQDFDRILATDNVHTQVDIFSKFFIMSLDECAPFVTKEITRPPAPWISDNLKAHMKTRDELQKKVKIENTNEILRNQYKQKRKHVRDLVQTDRSKHFKYRFSNCKGNVPDKWKIVHEMIPNTNNNSHVLNYQDRKVKAEEFNEYFANVGKLAFEKSQRNLNANNIIEDPISLLSESRNNFFRPQPVDIETIILVIKGLNETKSYGSDGIPLRFIRDALPVIIFYLTVIVNTSIVTGQFPKSWKLPHVIPLFKSGDVDEVGNYRPISLLPILSKILEKIVSNQLIAYLEQNSLLSHAQHGFRPHLSTETALMKMTEKIYSNVDNKKISLLMLLDLSKAFDSVSHNILLKKCVTLKIDPFWFKNYLENRCQSVRLGDIISSPREVEFGVPQGSILGPILFSIYINDMEDSLQDCLLIQYADDSQILVTGTVDELETLIGRAERILKSAKHYFQLNGLNINESKTKCIFIGSRQYISRIPENTLINFNGYNIGRSEYVKNLGVYFDQYMLFDTHINEICKKVNGTLIYLNRIKDRFDSEMRAMVVQSLALSIMNYCLKVYGSTSKEQLHRIQKLQNFAARVVDGKARKYDHASPILKNFQWLNIKQKFQFDLCVTVFKFINKLLPSWLFDISTVGSVRDRQTRNSNHLVIPRTTTGLGGRSFMVQGPSTWNKLPNQLKTLANINSFKVNLKKYIMSD